jgi:beta-1,4-mannosyl-glycoprotein beta-1,4-N-acetylglucosaminyltransferase
MKIYDGFLFFNELDLLEIRLNVLNDVVDHFIIVESSTTHQGTPKSFIFEENKDKFTKFLSKIIYIKVINTPDDFVNLPVIDSLTYENQIFANIYEDIKRTKLFSRATEQHFGRDFFQKECIKLGLYNCNDDDIILSSDLDEIPNPEILSRLNEFFELDQFYTFNQMHYCYYLNMQHFSHIDNSPGSSEVNSNWKGSRMASYKKIKDYSLNELRAQNNNDIIDGGWHFSWMGGIDRVKTKLKSYCHKENNNPQVIENINNISNNDNIENNLNQLISYFNQAKSVKVKIGYNHPEWLIKNQDKFKHLIK